MKLKEAIKILDIHNRWRRGADIKMQNPTRLGKAIDIILEYLKKEKNGIM